MSDDNLAVIRVHKVNIQFMDFGDNSRLFVRYSYNEELK